MKLFQVLMIALVFFTPSYFVSYFVYGSPYPGTVWSSDRIPLTIIGLRVGNPLSTSRPSLVVLDPKRLTVFNLIDKGLKNVHEMNAHRGEEWFKVELHDLDSDGLDEILISGLYHRRLRTVIVWVTSTEIKRQKEVPYYLSPIIWEGQRILVSQASRGAHDFSGPFVRMEWDSKKGELRSQDEIKLPGEVSDQTPSLFSVKGVTLPEALQGFIYLNSSGRIFHYKKSANAFKKTWTSGEEYGGSAHYLEREMRNEMNRVEDTRFFVPVSFHVDEGWLPSMSEGQGAEGVEEREPFIYVIKNSGYLANVVGAVPSIKNSQMVRLVWTGYGYQEDWNSPRYDGALADFDLVDWDGDGKEEVLAALLLRDRGYVDTLKRQDSLLIVIKPK